MPGSDRKPYFDATVTPHRSLNWKQAGLILKTIGAIFLVMSIIFATIGAWPVIFFCVIEITIVYLAFVWNFRDQKYKEHIIIDEKGFHLIRKNPKGKIQRHDLEANWLRVHLSRPRTEECHLTVSTHGRTLSLAEFLNPAEKQDLARAIEAALVQYRTAQ